MKHTKINVIKVLEVKLEDVKKAQNLTDNAVEKNQLEYEVLALQECIWLLTDKVYFNEVVDIYIK